MLNLRGIDERFALAGGWEHVPNDCKLLVENRFKAILDLQFTEEIFLMAGVKNDALNAGLEYLAIPMKDGGDQDLDKIYEQAEAQLSVWEAKFVDEDRILIKCGVGVSRSPSVLIYYLCMRDRLTYSEARNHIWRVDRIQPLLPISIDIELEQYLKKKFPDSWSME